jgi:hypothetical protein
VALHEVVWILTVKKYPTCSPKGYWGQGAHSSVKRRWAGRLDNRKSTQLSNLEKEKSRCRGRRTTTELEERKEGSKKSDEKLETPTANAAGRDDLL